MKEVVSVTAYKTMVNSDFWLEAHTFPMVPNFCLRKLRTLNQLFSIFEMLSIQFKQKNCQLLPTLSTKNFFEKIWPRILFSKKNENQDFFNFWPSSKLISDIFYFLWEAFLNDFLSKMKPKNGFLGFETNMKWSLNGRIFSLMP